MKPFNLTPNPRILIALTQTAMRPIDALCEVVDNAIDSFRGAPPGETKVNEIHINVPTAGELRSCGNEPFIKVSDNGPGMTPDAAEKALTAGYSSQDQLNSLGLFGVGLNIATGKFARKTRLITATKESSSALVVDLDLAMLVKQKNFEVKPIEKPKNIYFNENESGTIIELLDRWPLGNTNHEFPQRLIQSGPGHICGILGRRYAAYLRHDAKPRFKLFVNDKSCEPFEHCIWDASRSVPYGTSRRIGAKEEFDCVLQNRARCLECKSPFESGVCIADKSHSGYERIDERVRGWIGVQRYDNQTHFGIDLIRNGRAIRILEKDAFFTFTDDEGKQVKDYPIDSPYGRIVGEVHLDHVPVNFTKQDFERSTREWQEAMSFLRGDSSLQPSKPGASDNKSPLMKIFTGYRRVRNGGVGDLYMAQIDNDGNRRRIDRKAEKDFFERFNNKEEGYYDDKKWFEKVEVSVSDEYEDCPNPDCDSQNSPSAEQCDVCGWLLKSKECNFCRKKIPQSEDICMHCGKSQVPEGPWKCNVCGHTGNSPDLSECYKCHERRGAVNPFDIDILFANSEVDSSLSINDVEVELPNGGMSPKFNLETRNASLRKGKLHLPTVVDIDRKNLKVTVFLDKKHSLFTSLRMRPHYAVSIHAADFVYAETASIGSEARKHEHNHVVLAYRIMDKYWSEVLTDNPEQVRYDIHSLLDDVREKMVENLQESVEDIFNEMTNAQKQNMVSKMQEENVDISGMEQLRDSGGFMRYISPDVVVAVFSDYTSYFFGGSVWKTAWNIPGMPDEIAAAHQKEIKQIHLNCIEDCASFIRYQKPSLVVVCRARLSLEFLEKDMA